MKTLNHIKLLQANIWSWRCQLATNQLCWNWWMGTDYLGLVNISQLGLLLLWQQASPSPGHSPGLRGLGRLAHPPTSPNHRSQQPPQVCCPVPKEEEGRLALFSPLLFHFTEISYFPGKSVNYNRGTTKWYSVITRLLSRRLTCIFFQAALWFII